MIRCRQKLEYLGAGQVTLPSVKVDAEHRSFEIVSEKQCLTLPPVKSTDLDTLIKAGVPLESVSCKLLDPVGQVKMNIKKEDKNNAE